MLWNSRADDEPTRERVARSILENGPSTAAALAERLDLTPAAVRRHLDHLVAEGGRRGARAAPRHRRCDARPRPSGQGVRAHRDRSRPLRPAVRRPRRCRRSASWPRPAATRPSARSPTAGCRSSRQRFADVLTADPTLTPAEALARVFTDEGYAASVRELPWSGSRASASSSASSTARSPTSPTSSPSCARPRPRRSAGCSAATSSGWPPSPTATGSAPPASRPPDSRAASTEPTRERRSRRDVDRRAQPRAQGHRPLRVRLGRHRRRRRRRAARPQRGRRPRHLLEEERAAVDARPAPEGPQALRPQADAHVGLRPRRHRLRQHQVLRPLHREAGRHVGRPARGHQEHLRQARHPRGREAAPGRRRRRAVRVRGRLPHDPRGPRGAGRDLPRHRHRAARARRSSSRSTSAP